MSTHPEPTWTFEWLGHPTGEKRYVRVYFRDDSVPFDADKAVRELIELAQDATNEQLFNHAVLTFADRHHLRVVQVVTGPDHRYPGGDAVTVTFEPDRTPAVDVTE